MSLNRLKEAYDAHPLWIAVEELSAATTDTPDPETSKQQDDYDVLAALVAYMESLRQGSFSPLITSSALDSVKSQVDQVLSLVSNWKSTGDGNQLGQVYGPVQAIMNATGSWPKAKDRYFKGAMEIASSVQDDATKYLDTLRDEIETMRSEIVRTRERLTEFGSESDTRESAFNERADEIVGKVDQTARQVDDLVEGYGKKFDDLQEQLSEKFSDRISEFRENTKNMLNASDQEAQAGIQRIEELERQAKKLVDAVGLTGTATEYGKYAETQRTTADRMRIAASVAFAGGFLVFLFTLLFEDITDTTPWQFIALRFGGALTLFALGGYLSRESSQHRREERAAKSKQLDLAALDPFVASLDEQEKRQIKADAARRLFAQTPLADNAETGEANTIEVQKLSEVVSNMLPNSTKSSA